LAHLPRLRVGLVWLIFNAKINKKRDKSRADEDFAKAKELGYKEK
jgi:hypothetical protein